MHLITVQDPTLTMPLHFLVVKKEINSHVLTPMGKKEAKEEERQANKRKKPKINIGKRKVRVC